MMSYLPRLFYFGELLQVQFLWGCAKLVVANVNILEGTMCPLQSLTLQQRKYILLLWLPNLFFLMANAYHFSDSHNMGPEHVPRHGPRPHPTTWAPDTSHNMGPPISHSTAASLHRHPNPQLPYPTATPFTRSASLFDSPGPQALLIHKVRRPYQST